MPKYEDAQKPVIYTAHKHFCPHCGWDGVYEIGDLLKVCAKDGWNWGDERLGRDIQEILTEDAKSEK